MPWEYGDKTILPRIYDYGGKTISPKLYIYLVVNICTLYTPYTPTYNHKPTRSEKM